MDQDKAEHGCVGSRVTDTRYHEVSCKGEITEVIPYTWLCEAHQAVWRHIVGEKKEQNPSLVRN